MQTDIEKAATDHRLRTANANAELERQALLAQQWQRQQVCPAFYFCFQTWLDITLGFCLGCLFFIITCGNFGVCFDISHTGHVCAVLPNALLLNTAEALTSNISRSHTRKKKFQFLDRGAERLPPCRMPSLSSAASWRPNSCCSWRRGRARPLAAAKP